MCTYPLQQHKHKYLQITAPSMNPSNDLITVPSHVPSGSLSAAPIIVPINLPYQKPSSDPPIFPSSSLTTHPSQALSKNPSNLPYIVPSLKHYDSPRSVPHYVTLSWVVIVQHLHLFRYSTSTDPKNHHTCYPQTHQKSLIKILSFIQHMCQVELQTLQQHNHKHKVSLPKFPVLHFYMPSTTTKTETQHIVPKIPILICLHTLYNDTNINTIDHCQSSHSYMCTYPLLQHKHKHKCLLSKCSVLHVYIPSKATQTYTQRLVANIPSLACLHTLYYNISNNTNACC